MIDIFRFQTTVCFFLDKRSVGFAHPHIPQNVLINSPYGSIVRIWLVIRFQFSAFRPKLMLIPWKTFQFGFALLPYNVFRKTFCMAHISCTFGKMCSEKLSVWFSHRAHFRYVPIINFPYGSVRTLTKCVYNKHSVCNVALHQRPKQWWSPNQNQQHVKMTLRV